MNRYLVLAAIAGSALATQAGAQAGPDAREGGSTQAAMTRQQAAQLADGLFQRLDLNHDGVLTRQEVEQARSQMNGGAGAGAGDGRVERMIDRLFGDAQSVTLAQFEAAALARFDRQDLNHDGVVTAEERQQARSNRAQGN